jgi:hypothetical protein
LTAEAPIVHRGRTFAVVEAHGSDDRRIITGLATIRLAPAASPAEARSRDV